MPAPEFVQVPDVAGLPAARAKEVLEEADFYVSRKRQIRDIPGAPVVSNGQVITTNPGPGSQVPPRSQIVIFVKLSGLLAAIGSLAAIIVALAIGAVLFSVLSPDNIVKDIPDVEEPKAPDESKVVRPGADRRAGGLTVVPTFFKDAVSVGSEIRPVEVTNGSPDPVKANFYFIPIVGNNPDGIPEFRLSSKTISQGKRVVSVNQKKATLQPGETTEVRMKVTGDPGVPEYYGALLVETGRDDKSKASDPIKSGVVLQVNNIFQIAATRVLEFRPGGRVAGRVEQVRGFENEDAGGIGFTARVRNTGQLLAGPTGTISLFDSEGNLVKEIPIDGSQGILPGDYRETALAGREVFKDLDPGSSYTAQADIEMGNRSSSARWQFTLDEEGRLPTPAMRSAAVPNPPRSAVNERFDINVEVLNTGTATYSPRLDMKISPYGEATILEKQTGEMSEIDPGERVREAFSFKGIPEIGNYEFVAEVRSDEGVYLGQIVASVLVGEEEFQGPGLIDRIRDWMSANPLQTMLVGAALVVLLLAAGAFIWSKLHRRQ